MGCMGLILVVVGVVMLFVFWPLGLLFLALGVWMMSSGNRAAREKEFQARLLAEMQAQREAMEKERRK
jgi:Na+-transporting methylmalonyl-CoA/oxaloacetate decarboxylase gamma subunit